MISNLTLKGNKKEWSKKARKLRDTYSDNQLEEFKVELKKLSNMYWNK